MWEYRIELLDMPTAQFGNFAKQKPPEARETDLLAALGAEGWELVNVVPLAVFGNNRQIRLYFKRRRE